MRLSGAVFTAVLGLTLPATRGYGHHAVSVEFDISKRITLQGRVTKIDWMNPHVYLYLDVWEDGKTINWACETSGPNFLARQGWSRSSLKLGDHVTVVGYRARGGANVASAREVVLADGRKIYLGVGHEGDPRS